VPPVASTTEGAENCTNVPDSPVRVRTRDPVAGDPALGEQTEDRALHEDVDAQRNRTVLQGADHLQAGAVTDVSEAGETVAAEVALQDAPIGGAVERRAPLLELHDAVGRLLGVQLSHAPVVEHLAAAHGVAEVHAPVVLFPHVAHGGSHAALGHDGVGLAEQALAHDGGASPALVCLDRGTQAGTAGPDHDDVVLVNLSGCRVDRRRVHARSGRFTHQEIQL
jgi:hypothetical protein